MQLSKNIEADVPDNLLDETARLIQSEIFALQGTDCVPFKQNNLLLTAHQKFCKKTAIDFQPILNGSNAVKIAINKVKISYLQQSGLNRTVTFVDEPLKQFRLSSSAEF